MKKLLYKTIIFFDTEFIIDKTIAQPIQVSFLVYNVNKKGLKYQEEYSTYIQLRKDLTINPFIMEVTHLTALFLNQNGIEIEQAKKELKKFFNKFNKSTTVFCGWGLGNDKKTFNLFLDNFNSENYNWFDLANFYNKFFFKAKSKAISLEKACLDLEITTDKLHNSTSDAQACLDIFTYFLMELSFNQILHFC
ncbi:MAG: hypothetical protein LBM99_01870 [Bacillales bacterium]|jgi:DNA polymerase III epsilon subunit-like protein|nr:hypothetical protein [Bacillales bacterium]